MTNAPWRERILVVGLVVLLHLMVLAVWGARAERPAVTVNEMSVSFANVSQQQADVVPQPKLKRPLPDATEPAVAKGSVAPVPQPMQPSSPVVLDAEPDYRADYLANPRPPYPLVARRMGYHGRVVLNVEVLAEGRAGQVLLQQSCGHDILDNAALQTVRSWKFQPALHLGQPVTQWFLVPIKFSLEDSAA